MIKEWTPRLTALGLLFLGASAGCDPGVPATPVGASSSGAGGAGSGGGSGSTATGVGGAMTSGCGDAMCSRRIVSIEQGNPTCGVRASGEAVCWEGFPQSSTVALVDQAGIVDAVSASGRASSTYVTCFLLASGQVACKGSNAASQLGLAIPDSLKSDVPVVLPEVLGVVKLSVGYRHVCGALMSGQAMAMTSVPWMVPMTCRHRAGTPARSSSR